MMKKLIRKTDFRAVIAVLLAVSSLTGAIWQAAFAYSCLKNGAYTTSFENGTKGFGFEDVDFATVFTDADGNALLYDSSKNSIALYDAAAKESWNPLSTAAEGDGLAALMKITVRDKRGNKYLYNSSDNCKPSDCKFTRGKNTLNISFNLLPASGSAGASVSAELLFSLLNGRITVSADCSSLSVPVGYTVESISLLPGLMSVSETETDCMYYLPEGCGAAVDLSVMRTKELNLNLPVYSEDIAITNASESESKALLPYFSAQKGGSALTAVFTGGDALARVICNRPEGEVGGSLCSSFDITPVKITDGLVSFGKSFTGTASISFSFSALTPENALQSGYGVVSSNVRDILTEMQYLPEESLAQYDYYPVLVTLVGSTLGSKGNIATSFSDAEEMIALMHTKGIRGAILRFSGALDGGLYADSTLKAEISRHLGGKEGFSALLGTALAYDMSLYLEADIAAGGKVLRSPDRKAVLFDSSSDLKALMGTEAKPHTVMSFGSLSRGVSAVSALSESVGDCGIAVNDLSSALYSDSSLALTRQDVLKELKSKSSALSLGGLMLSNPAVYLMRYASFAANVPSETSLSGEDIASVPVLQMVLHGAIAYSSKDINTTGDGWTAALKCVEYGSVPSFLYTYSEGSEFSYGGDAVRLSGYYSRLKSLRKVQNMRMTGHEEVMPGVRRVTYDFSTVVYINYNTSIVSADGILLSPRDYVII